MFLIQILKIGSLQNLSTKNLRNISWTIKIGVFENTFFSNINAKRINSKFKYLLISST